MPMRVCLAVIPSADKALRNLRIFAFIEPHPFYPGGRHSSAIANILCIIERLEELHTKMQRII